MMGASLKEANFSLAGVYYAAGDDIKYQVLQNVGPVASSKVRPQQRRMENRRRTTTPHVIESSSLLLPPSQVGFRVDNVAGVKIPVFDKVSPPSFRASLFTPLSTLMTLITYIPLVEPTCTPPVAQVESETKTQDLTGLARGGQKVRYPASRLTLQPAARSTPLLPP